MTTLTVWNFPTADGAQKAEETLLDLRKQGLIEIHDAALTDVGIDDKFIKQVRDTIQPGNSALFVLSSGAVLDKIREAFAEQPMELIQSNLTDEEEAKLNAVLHDA